MRTLFRVTLEGLSRRQFLVHGSLYGGSLVVAGSLLRPQAALAAAESTTPVVLTDDEWRALDAIAARIIPTDADPGAREANCVNFVDKALAHEDAEALPVYRVGLAGVDAVASKRHAGRFSSLEAEQQDAILVALEDGVAEGWPAGPIASALFFETVRAHTVIGFLADPKYGGNRDYAGWKLVGYPGPRHHAGGYTPAQMLGEEPIRAAWGANL